eukprot:3722342-Alexandrium_andersonii.AAC.1
MPVSSDRRAGSYAPCSPIRLSGPCNPSAAQLCAFQTSVRMGDWRHSQPGFCRGWPVVGWSGR